MTSNLNDLGTFEGFNFREQCAIERILSANEVIEWDHDKKGEAVGMRILLSHFK